MQQRRWLIDFLGQGHRQMYALAGRRAGLRISRDLDDVLYRSYRNFFFMTCDGIEPFDGSCFFTCKGQIAWHWHGDLLFSVGLEKLGWEGVPYLFSSLPTKDKVNDAPMYLKCGRT